MPHTWTASSDLYNRVLRSSARHRCTWSVTIAIASGYILDGRSGDGSSRKKTRSSWNTTAGDRQS